MTEEVEQIFDSLRTLKGSQYIAQSVGTIRIGDYLTVNLATKTAHATTDGEKMHAMALSNADDGEMVTMSVFDMRWLVLQAGNGRGE